MAAKVKKTSASGEAMTAAAPLAFGTTAVAVGEPEVRVLAGVVVALVVPEAWVLVPLVLLDTVVDEAGALVVLTVLDETTDVREVWAVEMVDGATEVTEERVEAAEEATAEEATAEDATPPISSN